MIWKGGAAMNKDKKTLYIISFTILALLLSALFWDVGSSKIVAVCLLIPLTFATCFFIRKRHSLSINKKEVLLLSGVIGVLYVALYQMTGFFLSFYENPYFVTAESLYSVILPTALIIILTEIIRSVLLAQNNLLVSAITYFSCVIAEVLIFSNVAGITSFYRFMDLIGLTLLPAITANIYYHYVSKRYGMMPNILFRLITTLYVYFSPLITSLSDSLTSCIKIILPIILLSFVSALFETKKKTAVKKGKKLGALATVLTLVLVISVAMLISCHFRYGALVIATDSMTGEINKGDMIIYERYDGQPIQEGQVIVFLQYESKIVHRVVKIENIGGETRYYTKGDANEDLDSGYRVASDIFALTDVKLSFIGYPSLWLREILKS